MLLLALLTGRVNLQIAIETHVKAAGRTGKNAGMVVRRGLPLPSYDVVASNEGAI